MYRVAIIGTAGRGDDAKKMTPQVYRCMFDFIVQELLVQNLGPIELVSGGAAWSDHLAIALWHRREKLVLIEVEKLTLFLPCRFSTGPNPGYISELSVTANYYHHQMSKKLFGTNGKTLASLASAIDQGANVIVSYGFHARNELSVFLVVFTCVGNWDSRLHL